MSIDAVITDVEYEKDGTCRLDLGPRGTLNGSGGQKSLYVTNPKPNMDACVGTEIWGGSGSIMVGDTLWARRNSYTEIELVTARL